MKAVLAPASFWAKALPAELDGRWMADAQRIALDADTRRVRADYDTGSILPFEAYMLRALADHLAAQVAIEVGTFIGTSTMALAAASSVHAVYTCDVSNDCLGHRPKVTSFPKVRSTEMFRRLVALGVCADLCFFDGVLEEQDIALLAALCHPRTVFAVHDYNFGPKIRKNGARETMPRKGIGNARLLQQKWPTLTVVEPLPGTTLALLVPEGHL